MPKLPILNTFSKTLALIVIVWCCSHIAALSQPYGVIRGVTLDARNGKPVPGVSVLLEGEQRGATAGAAGAFVIRGVPAGSYTLLASRIGYKAQKIEIALRAGDTVNITLQLAEELLQTDEVVVSASKRVQAAQDVPISISTVDQRSLEQRGIVKLENALRYVPGVYVTRDQVNVRGSSGFALGLGARTLFLVDGLPLLAGDQGDVKFDAIPIFSLERIEVVKGAGSALYGTSALGGVVNLITQKPSIDPELRFRTYSGFYTLPEFEEWRYRETVPYFGGANVGYSQSFGDFGLLASGGYRRDEGFHDFIDFERWNVMTKVRYEASPRTTVSLFATHASEEKANWIFWEDLANATRPNSSDGVPPKDRILSLKTTVAADVRHIVSDNFFALVRAGMFRTDFESRNVEEGDDQTGSEAIAWNGEAQLTSIIDRNVILTYGASLQHNVIVESIILDESEQSGRKQTIIAGYLQGEYKPASDLTLTAGGRIDRESTENVDDEVTEISPKFGVSFQASDETRFRGSVGSGFRTPTITEKFGALKFAGFTVQPNFDLQPEKSISFEIGGMHKLSLAGGEWTLNAAVFLNEFTDLIEPQLPTLEQPNIAFRNVTRARIYGVEASVKGWLPGNLAGIEAAITAMNPEDIDSNTTLKYRSKFLANVRVIVPVGMFQLQADYRYQARFETIDDDIALFIDDADARVPIHVVDARLLINLFEAAGLPMNVSINAKNIFNYNYAEIIANLGATRSIALQVDAQL